VKTLTSLENPIVKSIRRLQQKPAHRAGGSTVIEGLKLANEALASGIEIAQALISVDLVSRPAGRALLQRLEAMGVPAVTVDERVLRRCSSLDSPEGVLLVGRIPLRPPDQIDQLSGKLVVVVAGVQDPGNLGAIARVAEATGVSSMIVTRGTTHPFHPKALRGSMGSLLRLPIVDGGEPESVGALLKKKGFALAACVPRGGVDIREAALTGPLAIALGSEGSGLSKNLLKACDLRLSVPMKGSVDSLNVAVVAGLVLYEAARRRGTI
jgi:TrmH family RNA methyltransferase